MHLPVILRSCSDALVPFCKPGAGRIVLSLPVVLLMRSCSGALVQFCKPDAEKIVLSLPDPLTSIQQGVIYTGAMRQREIVPGRHIQSHPTPNIKRYAVLGERNSCTTALSFFIRSNLDFNCSPVTKHHCAEFMEWRHSFPSSLIQRKPNTTLFFLVTRHPYEWLQSMRRNPFWANCHKNRSLVDFMSLEWMSFNHTVCPSHLPLKCLKTEQRSFFEEAEDLMGKYLSPPTLQGLQPLSPQHCPRSPPDDSAFFPGELLGDRDPSTGERFPTIMAMREAKLRDWLQSSARVPYAHHISCTEFMRDPEKLLQDISTKFNIKRFIPELVPGAHSPCVFSFGRCVSSDTKAKREYYLTGRHMEGYDNVSLSLANAWLDPDLERRFGYDLFDTVEAAVASHHSYGPGT